MAINSFPNGFPKRKEMLEIIQTTVHSVEKTEYIPFYKSRGRVLAESVYSRDNSPNVASSGLDGIAVRFDDFQDGMPDTSAWKQGQEYEYCNTGIGMPTSYDTVIAIEDVTIGEKGIDIAQMPRMKRQFVYEIGSNMKAGEKILSKGRVLTSGDISLLASARVMEVKVFCKPSIAVIPTGDELVSPWSSSVMDGQNVECNSFMLANYIEEYGATPYIYPTAKDNPDTIINLLTDALGKYDAALIIAGSSLGTKDFTISILDSLGKVLVPELAHGPGRKSSLSIVHKKPVLGIAGPPMGAQVASDLYLGAFVYALRGLPSPELPKIEVISEDDFREYDVDFCERVFIIKRNNEYYMKSIFKYKTTRAQMNFLAKGIFYRPAYSKCEKGDRVQIELSVPIEQIATEDILKKMIDKGELKLK